MTSARYPDADGGVTFCPAKSTHAVEVVRVGADQIEKHPNADKLSIVKLFGGGYQVIVKSDEWAPGSFGAYVPPDSLVPLDRPEFSWLRETGRSPKVVDGREYHLVRTVKLRGMQSMGLLIKPTFGVGGASVKPGDDLAQALGVLHYEPPERTQNTSKNTYGSQAEPAPESKPPSYDLDSLRRYSEVFVPGEPVWVSEKIHGANARYAYEDRGFFSHSIRRGSVAIRFGRHAFTWARYRGFKHTVLPEYARYIRVGSRNQWKRPDPTDVWWKALTPEVAKFLKALPHLVVYGEVYGPIQDLDYGSPHEPRFVAFDVFDTNKREFINSKVFLVLMKNWGIPTVPTIHYAFPFDLERVLKMAEGISILAMENLAKAEDLKLAPVVGVGISEGRFGSKVSILAMGNPNKSVDFGEVHLREGVVVKPVLERMDPRVGRVALKVVGEGYYSR